MEHWCSGLLFTGIVIVWFYGLKLASPNKKKTPVFTIESYTTPYTMKYKTLFEEMECIPLSDNRLCNLQSIYIKEVTDKGDTVIMCYSNDNEAFHYWCDNRNISFMELDAVGQLYTLVNQCKRIYKETEPTVDTRQPKSSKTPMVSFKTYNRPNEKMHDTYHKYNRFTRRGCIQEWMCENIEGEWSTKHGLDPTYKVVLWIASKTEEPDACNHHITYKDWVSTQG